MATRRACTECGEKFLTDGPETLCVRCRPTAAVEQPKKPKGKHVEE